MKGRWPLRHREDTRLESYFFRFFFFPFKLRQFKENPNENHQAVLNIVIPFLPHSLVQVIIT